jgi:hypothetical protein
MALDVGKNTYGDSLGEVSGFLEGEVRGRSKLLFEELRPELLHDLLVVLRARAHCVPRYAGGVPDGANGADQHRRIIVVRVCECFG